MKRLFFTIWSAFICCCLPMFAAGNARAIMFYKLNLTESAQEMFRKNLADNANKAETCYYLGKIALQMGQPDSASYYFNEGLKANPDDVYNHIGIAQLLLISDKAKGSAALSQILSGKNKKDPGICLAVAAAYLETSNTDYNTVIENVLKDNDKNSDIYIFKGDAARRNKNYGDACVQYEQAIYYNPKAEEAYLKYAQVYENKNPDLAMDMLNKLLTVNPDSELAYREKAEVCFASGHFNDAAANYEKYLSFEIAPSDHDLERYASILFYNKEYDKAMSYVSRVLSENPRDQVMNRLQMYINSEKTQTPELLAQANSYMTSYSPGEYIPLDYLYYGRTLMSAKKTQDAIIQFNKALELNGDKAEAYRALAEAYESIESYDQAIRTNRIFMNKLPNEFKASDYLVLGKEYYFAGNALPAADSLKKQPFLQTADSLFTEVTRRSPDNSLGFIWKARALSSLDPETTKGLAKPAYEKIITLLEAEGKDKKKLSEAYNYMGFYYFVANDLPASLTFWNKTLTIDPENQTAKKAIQGINDQMNGKKTSR